MRCNYLPVWVLWGALISPPVLAQNAFNNATNPLGSSDNTGHPIHQMGTEVLNSTPGMGVRFEPGGSFEHIGQFYVAKNGIWNNVVDSSPATAGTDYFGYAPIALGTDTPYLGIGIRGASANNGGRGSGRPTFGHLQLNSTGLFPVEAGMYIVHSLAFNSNGPGRSNVVTTPNASSPDSPANAVVFAPSAKITGADQANYINGFASVTGVIDSFSLPLGDADGFPDCLHPLTVNNSTAGTVTARYRHISLHSSETKQANIGSVSPIGNWSISAPEGTKISVSIPAFDLNPAEINTLRLVGWTGSQWVNISDESTAGICAAGNCSLTGTLRTGITELGIGSTSRVFAGKESGEGQDLSVWPNPTHGKLHVGLPSAQTVSQVQVIDLQGRSVLQPQKSTSSVDASALASGQYVVEVITTQGQTLRKSFVKQP